nr:L,D-transpeptidase family protein [Nitratireductor sp.]
MRRFPISATGKMLAMMAAALVMAAFSKAALAQALPIQQTLQQFISEARNEAVLNRLKEIDAHYALNEYTPIWISGGEVNDKAMQVIDALNLAYEDGLDPADYHALDLLEESAAETPEELAQFEIDLTASAVAFAQHLNAGRVNPRAINREQVRFPVAVAPEAILTNMRKTSQPKVYLRLLAPHTQRYDRLRQALGRFRAIEANGGYSTVPEGPVIKPGATDARVPAIRQRMVEAGTLQEADVAAGEVYDEALAKAVIAFQETMGLEALGTIGKQTMTAMNTPVSRRIFEIELNLERNRWLQNEFAPYHIFANLADQVVKVVRDDKTIHAELIQVGQPYHQTPEFTDEMEYIEFNPYWGVPSS